MTRSESDVRADDRPAFSFADVGSAARYERICKLLSVRASSQLHQFIAETGNPDQAVLQLEVILQRHPYEAIAAFESGGLGLRSCVALFGCSQWLSQTVLRNPDLLQSFSRSGGLVPPRGREDFREQFARFRLRSHEEPLSALLARFKRREYVRIFVRELLGLASLSEVTEEISALSDVLIEAALAHSESEMRRLYQGWPQLESGHDRVSSARFSILSLGKLGGDELNYSSDIDLLYICDDAPDAKVINISSREFFTRLAQEVTAVLSTMSVDGQVFRVDLRLRPQGASGEMVAGFGQAVRYYGGVAQDWELQALLKLRHSAGNRELAREFVERLQELIYCQQLNLSAVQTAAHSLERVRLGIQRRGDQELNVKNGPGGLREIEFVVQCLQRVHGRSEPWLRSSGTLSALQKLHDKGHVGDSEYRELCGTYELLRSIEHRLQCQQGLQLHRLPRAVSEQVALFRSLGDGLPKNAEDLKVIMRSASDLCARIFKLGSCDVPAEVTPQLLRLSASGAESLARELATCSPALACALNADIGDPTLRNLKRFLASASTGDERTRVTAKNAVWVERALPVFACSVMATDILARNPADIVALFGNGKQTPQGSVSDQLRVGSRRRVLRTIGRSILEDVSVWDILREHSQGFDAIIQQAMSAIEAPAGFAVLALGRLGTCELDVLSDADLLFVRSTDCETEAAERCAHSLVAMLSIYTREGSVIAVDTRLRPHGLEGDLVCTPRQLAQYFEYDAKAWETLAFSKLRLIAGTESLSSETTEAVRCLQRRFAASPQFVSELRAMRKRIADSGGGGNFKTDPGGLYDLDFLLGLLEARAGFRSAGRQAPERLGALLKRELLSTQQAAGLLSAVNLFRRVDHAVRVVAGKSQRWLPESDALRMNVQRMIGLPDPDDALHSEMSRVRGIFDFYFSN